MANITCNYSALLVVAIDGRLQQWQSFVSVGQSYEDDGGGSKPVNRVEVGWAMPDTGLEFDGRPHLGTDRRFNVTVVACPGDRRYPLPAELSDAFASLPHIQHGKMELRSFSISQKKDEWARVRAVFVCGGFDAVPA